MKRLVSRPKVTVTKNGKFKGLNQGNTVTRILK